MEAVKVFEQACSHPAPDARYYFHLSLAQLKLGHAADAKAALKKAEGLELSSQALTAEERLSLNSLQQQLAER